MPQHLVTAILFDGTLSLEWEETPFEDTERLRYEKLLLTSFKQQSGEGSILWLLMLGLFPLSIKFSESIVFWHTFSSAWIHALRTLPNAEELRDSLHIDLIEEDAQIFLHRMPSMIGIESVDSAFLAHYWNSIGKLFTKEICSFKGSIEDFLTALAPFAIALDRIHFHLVENRKDEQRPFAFLATYAVRVDDQGRTRHLPLKHAFEEYATQSDKLLALLSTVKKVGKKSPLIHSMIENGEIFKVIGLTPEEASRFLLGVKDFEESGILCRIPRWWKGSQNKAAITLSLGSKHPTKVGANALLDFSVKISLGGEILSVAEVKRILERAEGLVFVKGKWIAVDVSSLQKTLAEFQQAKTLAEAQEISFSDAMRLLMGAKTENALLPLVSNTEVTSGEWLTTVLEKMVNPSLIRTTVPSSQLKAELRPYQQQGFNWLCFMQSLGFGLCLADDMGLGKTVQMLAHLQKLKQSGRTSIIIVPASLLENWRREIEKFTPDLRVAIIHPQMMDPANFKKIEHAMSEYDIAITTYTLLSRLAWLSVYDWFYVICDEAQAIKNPGTRQTKAVKELHCKHRCVMTGTPVENRLTDLWSLFDFINPGLLGSFGEFKNFAKRLKEHPEGYGKLRRTIHPYILRRSKTDKTIINDLPDKIEIKTWCSLSKPQAMLYGQLIERLESELDNVNGIARKGLVLSYLMKCKQLCNHPDHYAGNGAFLTQESGKFMRLAELCQTIHEKREKLLVFTQFAEIIQPLNSFLAELFGKSGCVLSGSSSVKNRKEAVECFQSSEYIPYFILSLKAGGVGLNLTEANHVVHFDRWWNPAVENQATDRAFRIGQKKNVMVHKFICKGTIEEKIDALIDDKKKLAHEVVPTGAENWITELDDTRIKEMFKLTITGED